MKSSEIEYCWLTSPLRVQDEFLGACKGLPLPFLLRHGAAPATHQHPLFTNSEEIDFIRSGGRRFYLATVKSGGVALDLSEVFFLISSHLNGILVGPKLFQGIDEKSNLKTSYDLAVDPYLVSAHAWNYDFPSHPDDNSLYLRLFKALHEKDLETVGGDNELMRKLCKYKPAQIDLPQLYMILTTKLIAFDSIAKIWDRDRIVIQIGPKAIVRTWHGDVPATIDLFRSQPILKYEGFLIPQAVAPLFNTDSNSRWPELTCIKNVTLQFNQNY